MNSQYYHAPVLWLMGLSGSGKTTISNHLKQHLEQKLEYPTIVLDGDVLRHGLNSNLKFSDQDRSENCRRVAEIAKLLSHDGFYVIVALITPFEKDRTLARQIIGDKYIEIFVDCELATCQQRDVKGLYQQVKEGKITQFTGISSPFEPPTSPELVVNTEHLTIEQSVQKIVSILDIFE